MRVEWKVGEFSYSPFWDEEMLREVTRGNGPRLTGGPSQEGGGQLEANVLHHDRSIVARLFHVLLCAGGLDLTLAVSLSLRITLNNHHPSRNGHKTFWKSVLRPIAFTKLQ